MTAVIVLLSLLLVVDLAAYARLGELLVAIRKEDRFR